MWARSRFSFHRSLNLLIPVLIIVIIANCILSMERSSISADLMLVMNIYGNIKNSATGGIHICALLAELSTKFKGDLFWIGKKRQNKKKRILIVFSFERNPIVETVPCKLLIADRIQKQNILKTCILN